MRNILVAVDGSPFSQQIVQKGYELARALNGELALLHVIDPQLAISAEGIAAQTLLVGFREEASGMLNRLKSAVGDEAALVMTETGPVAKTILHAARQWEADVIVLGTHGRTGLSHLVLGSVAEHVVRHATIPVLIISVKNPPEDTSGDERRS
ncbi:MAG TPA: universal stress protein [Chitinophagaceae bacterium]|nr:universal stress protein [Chitinophagaceae bacterium]